MIKKILLPIAFALFATLAAAQSESITPTPDNDVLYKTFGEKPGLVALMDDFMVRLMTDPRTRPFFEPANRDHVKKELVEQFCQVTGGPCVYKGVDMKNAHAELEIRKSHFNALIEVLQQSMDARGIPFRAQNQLLAQLAPMHRDIITTP
jgi:hemoglobin